MKTRNLITLIFSLLLLFPVLVSAKGEDNWLTNYDEAKAKAQKENKTLMLYFAGTDWCKPCILLKRQIFETQEFEDFANDNLVIVMLDFPRLKKNKLPKEQITHNEALAEKYNQEGSFPLVVFTDTNGKVLDKSGFKSDGATAYIKYVKSIMK